jgi:transposase
VQTVVSSQGWTARTEDVPLRQLVAVPVDVGKSAAMVMACDFTRRTIMPATEFPMTRAGIAAMLAGLRTALPADVWLVRVGVEAAGHYHRPMIASGVWPQGWQVLELNPAHVTAQRRVNGSRGVKTDRVDLVAIADLWLAGRGVPVVLGDEPLLELQAWVAHRRRRVEVRTATKNQLIGQLDRAFPGLGGAIHDVLGSKVGRLVAAHFSDPARLARLGAERFRDYAARRDVRVSRPMAAGLVAAARDALPTPGAAAARHVLAADLALLDDLEDQIGAAEARIAALLPSTDYQILTTTPGWGVIRVAGYAAALGRPTESLGLGRQDLPSIRADPDRLRLGRPPPRRRHQPRGLGAPAPRSDRVGSRPVATRPRLGQLRPRPARARQARRHYLLRAGPPSQQNRLRDGP